MRNRRVLFPATVFIASWLLFVVMTAVADGDPTLFASLTGTCDGYTAAFPYSAAAHSSIVLRVVSQGTSGTVQFGSNGPPELTWGANDVLWMPVVGADPSVVDCQGLSGTYRLSLTDTPKVPTSYTGASTAGSDLATPSGGTGGADSYLPFTTPLVAEYVAKVILSQGAVTLGGGPMAQTFTSSGTYKLGTLGVGTHSLSVKTATGPQAQWTISVSAVPGTQAPATGSPSSGSTSNPIQVSAHVSIVRSRSSSTPVTTLYKSHKPYYLRITYHIPCDAFPHTMLAWVHHKDETETFEWNVKAVTVPKHCASKTVVDVLDPPWSRSGPVLVTAKAILGEAQREIRLATLRVQFVNDDVVGIPTPSARNVRLCIEGWNAYVAALPSAASKVAGAAGVTVVTTSGVLCGLLFWTDHTFTNELYFSGYSLATSKLPTQWTFHGVFRASSNYYRPSTTVKVEPNGTLSR